MNTSSLLFFLIKNWSFTSSLLLYYHIILTHVSLSSWPFAAPPLLWFWASWSLCCSRCLFLIPRHKDNISMATPEPTSTNATDDALFFLVSVSPSEPEPLLLFSDTSAGTTLHTIITMPRATSPTPRAHNAYWEP